LWIVSGNRGKKRMAGFCYWFHCCWIRRCIGREWIDESLNWFRPLDLATCHTFIPSSQNYAIITYLTLNFGFSSSIKFKWLFNLALCFKFILAL
jgi:hypothetical protein